MLFLFKINIKKLGYFSIIIFFIFRLSLCLAEDISTSGILGPSPYETIIDFYNQLKMRYENKDTVYQMDLSDPINSKNHEELQTSLKFLDEIFLNQPEIHSKMTRENWRQWIIRLNRLENELINKIMKSESSHEIELLSLKKVELEKIRQNMSTKLTMIDTHEENSFKEDFLNENDGISCRTTSGPFQLLSNLGETGFSVAQKVEINDVPNICRESVDGHLLDKFIKYSGGDSFDDLLYSKREQYEQILNSRQLSESQKVALLNLTPWMVNFFPSEKIHRWYFENGMWNESPLSNMGFPDPLLTARAILEGKIAPPEDPLQEIPFTQEPDPSLHPDESQLKLGASALCFSLEPLHSNSCSKGVIRIYDRFNPGFLSMRPLFEKILRDPVFEKGISRAALRIIDRYQETKDKPIQISESEHLFDDLKDSFLKEGLSSADAEDHAWDVMGLIATAGANLGSRLQILHDPKFSSRTKLGLFSIAVISPFLDHLTYSSGHPYSYPHSVTTKCDDGKSYHFWMSAYLARDLTRELGNPIAAQAASFALEKAYQAFSRTEGRFPERYLSEPQLSMYNFGPRIDLAKGASGAVFGSNSAYGLGSEQAKKKIDVDQAIIAQLQQMKYFEPLGQKDATALTSNPLSYGWKWNQIYAPDAAYRAVSR